MKNHLELNLDCIAKGWELLQHLLYSPDSKCCSNSQPFSTA